MVVFLRVVIYNVGRRMAYNFKKSRTMKLSIWSKTFLRAGLCWSLFMLAVLVGCPIRNTPIKAGLLLSVFAAWLFVFLLSRRGSRFRYAVIAVTVIAIVYYCMPARAINEKRLRELYVRSLLLYNQRPYVWGAENFLAVDCSGLVRQGYIDAGILHGIRTVNGALFRESMLLWWYDSSARAMRDGYRGRTRRVLEAGCLNDLDHSRILPGDFAVTQNGVHCLAYLGEGRWIQADPACGKVIIGQTPEEDAWYQVPVYIMRWSVFSDGQDG